MTRRPRPSGLAWRWFVVAATVLVACGVNPATPAVPPMVVLPSHATPGPNIVVALGLETATPAPTPDRQALAEAPRDSGLRETLKDYPAATADDADGARSRAFETLHDFVNPHSQYSGAWWFLGDGQADIYEVLAVILYTEGNTSWDVRTAVSARYLWYCGGTGTTCRGPALIDFLSYFQPWREPWIAPGFTSDQAAQYLDYAKDLVLQRPGLLTAVIPGADTYTHNDDGLSMAGPIDWLHTPFHFANVDPTWDTYLRQKLRRLPNGPSRLWVLTIAEAGWVCRSQFVCDDMTRPRQ